jgi:glutamate synthase domain-containing protein 2
MEFAAKLEAQGLRVPDLAMAGGFAHEPDIYKVLALGSPYFKAVCMGRALMIPGMLGKNIEQWMKDDNLPKTISKYGTSVEEIFINYEEVKEKYGSDMKDIPLGAVALFTFARKTKVGLQQLMAGSRRFSLPAISQKDLMSLSEECAKVTGIPYVMDSYRDEAEDIIAGK